MSGSRLKNKPHEQWVFLGSKHGVPSLLNTWTTPQKQRGDIFWFSSVVLFYVGVLGHDRRPVGGILSLHEAAEWRCERENVSVDLGAGSEWGDIQFRVNYPFR